MKGRILSGMRPTGRLHLGHLSVLENWQRLQDEYECFYTVVDWHALTTAFDTTGGIRENIQQMVLDWLSVGIDPSKSTIFVQSHVKQHAELHLLFSMITPLSWLERCPTYKEQLLQFGKEGKDLSTYGFLGYPLLQAADILVYRADTVPVGEDQLPHLELCREVARRFNFIYQKKIFPEPQARLAKLAIVPGIDGRKMSKSYHNDISLDASPEEIKALVTQMITDPARIHKTDPGHPEVCIVHSYHQIYSADDVAMTADECRGGRIGCVACKKLLTGRLAETLAPIRERRRELEAKPQFVADILEAGAERAQREAEVTMTLVREAIGI